MIDQADLTKDDRIYLTGWHNFAIRTYFYLQQGLNVLNSFRNLFLGIFGLYITLKLGSWWWLVVMFSVSLPILVLAGRYSVHRLNKVQDWLTMRFSTHFGIKQFDNIREQVELLREIRDALEKLNEAKGS